VVVSVLLQTLVVQRAGERRALEALGQGLVVA
jgi:hypothetical protein